MAFLVGIPSASDGNIAICRHLTMTILLTLLLPLSSLAVFIPFDNCLPNSIKQGVPPLPLQFVPLFVDASFNTSRSNNTLTVTVFGNVTGQSVKGPYPAPDDPRWMDPNDDYGQIVNVTQNFTTLQTTLNFLTYTPHDKRSPFCSAVGGKGCPLKPLIGVNESQPEELHQFTISHDMDGQYSFATIDAQLLVRSGKLNGPQMACVNAVITPDLTTSVSAALRWIPIVILGLVGVATVLAAKYGPNSSKSFFYWTSFFGRDEDMLRLVTPGFGDCLQYIQFIVLSGSLSLEYPGYYQPVVSKASWSTLTFNESFVSHGEGFQSLQDGIYLFEGKYGLSRLAKLVGMTDDTDIWAGMAIWLCVITGGVIVLCQIGFAINWIVRKYIVKSAPEDLRNRNLPFTAGCVTRIVFNFFLLPIVSLSMFQLVIAGKSPAAVVALAVVLLIFITAFTSWVFYMIFTTNPRTYLFDKLTPLLMYGPLYNTYSDESAPFAVVPIMLNILRGVAIGAVQPAGIAQLVILAICEIVFFLSIHAFRPFQAATSMNAYHTFFAVFRLVTILLSIAFVPSLSVSEGIKGWLGYIILLLHAIVLVFGFFMNAIQTLIEILARMAGVEDPRGGLIKVFGVRQLSKRTERRHHDSLTSSAAMLDSEYKPVHSHRLTSMSGGSRHLSMSSAGAFEQFSQAEEQSTRSGVSPGPSTPGGHATPMSFLPNPHDGHNRRSGGALQPPAPYYRPPRLRRPTLEAVPGEDSLELERNDGYSPNAQQVAELEEQRRSMASPAPTSIAGFGDDSAVDLKKKTDYYAMRESDFLYQVRGPALSSASPTRRRVTGPADPMSPVSSATGWFKNMFGGRRKEKGKGFEVVRSTPLHRMPPDEEEEHTPAMAHERYQDSPPRAVTGVTRDRSDSNLTDQLTSRPETPPRIRPLSFGGTLPGHARIGSRDSAPIDTNLDTSYQPPRRSRAPSVTQYRPQQAQTQSHLTTESRIPFGTDDATPNNENRSGSMSSSIYPNDVEPLDRVDTNLANPAFSTGRVHQRLASESIQTYTLPPSHMGSTAELVEAETVNNANRQPEGSRPGNAY